jgi:hypothetical protein
LASLRASGGGDGPEDIAGAFEGALEQDWASMTKWAILITDAPCHGKRYHSLKQDDYPDGDPHGRAVE